MALSKKGGRPSKLILFSVLVLLMGWAIIPRVITVYSLTQQKGELERQKVQLQALNQQLIQEKESLNSPQTLEKIARERLGMLKDGERYIIQKEDKK